MKLRFFARNQTAENDRRWEKTEAELRQTIDSLRNQNSVLKENDQRETELMENLRNLYEKIESLEAEKGFDFFSIFLMKISIFVSTPNSAERRKTEPNDRFVEK